MRTQVPASLGLAACLAAAFAQPALADDSCAGVKGDAVLAARTPQVDLYDGANGKRVMTMAKDKFPACVPIIGRAPNMMLQIQVNGSDYWVPPYMVHYRFAGPLPAICRNLALGSNEEKVGSTRGLGEGCPKTGTRTAP
jgi:hypothetical protein